MSSADGGCPTANTRIVCATYSRTQASFPKALRFASSRPSLPSSRREPRAPRHSRTKRTTSSGRAPSPSALPRSRSSSTSTLALLISGSPARPAPVRPAAARTSILLRGRLLAPSAAVASASSMPMVRLSLGPSTQIQVRKPSMLIDAIMVNLCLSDRRRPHRDQPVFLPCYYTF